MTRCGFGDTSGEKQDKTNKQQKKTTQKQPLCFTLFLLQFQQMKINRNLPSQSSPARATWSTA